MNGIKTRTAAGLAFAALFSIVAVLSAGGCGGGGLSTASVAAGGTVFIQDKPDNPIFPVSPSHPMRIVFLSDNNPDQVPMLYAIDANGGRMALVSRNWIQIPSGGTGTSADGYTKSPTFSLLTPGISQDGLTVFYASDFYATSTEIMKINLDGLGRQVVSRSALASEEPRVSWDGRRLAFTRYSTRSVTALISPEDQSTSNYLASLLYLGSAGYAMGTATGIGIAPMGVGPVLPAACLTADYTTDGSTLRTVYTFTPEIGDIRYTDVFGNNTYPYNKYFCLKMDATNHILLHISEYAHGMVKNPSAPCATTADCPATCSGSRCVCTNTARCVGLDGSMTTIPCNANSDCESNECNGDRLCPSDSGVPAHITFDWVWVERGFTGEPVTISDVMNTDETRSPMGVNLIRTFDFRDYELYVMNADGSLDENGLLERRLTNNVDDPDRYPCFSPASSNVVYYTKGIIDDRYMDYDRPGSSSIVGLNILTGETETVIPGNGRVVRGCSFSPSGKSIAYSRHNGRDYDIYVYDIVTGTASFVTDTGGDDLYPSFSPDGTRIVFQSDESGDNDIYVTDLRGTRVVNITNNRDKEDVMPVWAP